MFRVNWGSDGLNLLIVFGYILGIYKNFGYFSMLSADLITSNGICNLCCF